MEADEPGSPTSVRLKLEDGTPLRSVRNSYCKLSSCGSLQNLCKTELSVNSDYALWVEQYPSILEKFSEFQGQLDNKKLVLFLDYDGTLSPIVRNPDEAFMPEETRTALKKIASIVPTAIISGRCMEKIVNFVQLKELFYAGSHGLDIRGPEIGICASCYSSCAFQPAAEYFSIMHELYEVLVQNVHDVPGSSVEHNKFSVSVHFRNCDPQDWSKIAEIVNSTVKSFDDMLISQGKKVLEIKPDVAWNKGKAVSYLLQELGLAEDPDAFPVYIGDDTTDEDAFQVLRELGIGTGILVSKKARPTKAKFSVKDPSEVFQFLQKLGTWVNSALSSGTLNRPDKLEHIHEINGSVNHGSQVVSTDQ